MLIPSFLQKPYLLNKHTREIHDIEASKKNCRIKLMAGRNRKRITRRKAMRLIAEGEADGCRWCMREQDNG